MKLRKKKAWLVIGARQIKPTLWISTGIVPEVFGDSRFRVLRIVASNARRRGWKIEL